MSTSSDFPAEARAACRFGASVDVTWLDTLRLGARAARIRSGPVAHTRDGMRIVDVSNCAIRVRVTGVRAGHRPTIVLVCDPPSVIEHFDMLVGLLAPKARVVCLEPPGFGFSVPRRNFRFSFDSYRSAIDELLLALDEGPYLLAFSCVWAHIALQIAAQRPASIAKLLLWQGVAWEQQVSWADHVDMDHTLVRPLVGQLAGMFGTRRIGIGWYRAAMAKDRYRDFTPTLLSALDNGAFCCLASLWQQFYRETPPEVQVDQPTLLTWGHADRTHRHSDKTSLSRALHRVVWHGGFERSGHSPELEDCPAFARLLLDWLAASDYVPLVIKSGPSTEKPY
ncbi:alpha/beta fold hydrolase [Burkholderia gladioli]|uniref:Alpha/beta hydrolase n=1 Tax=Burkholderia gladioli (strain BSR3) TaxID=999541 RepID=F2LT44_BURGS|nr:alpha/beta hydrolase [Burkholderia gladioli]AEA65920.1 hypothetical protein bgla_4p1360 [Burkholderia gladioli BSR3]MBW5286840.1 alpha/beta hydrolase [Burkholderia gladioli]